MKDKILEFWESRAKLGETAGTNDFILSRIERAFLCEMIPNAARVLDVGCGNGASLIQLGQERGCFGVGIDFSSAMVTEARVNIASAGLDKRFEIHEATLPPVPDKYGLFDVVYSQRCLINLRSPDEQCVAVQSVASVLKPGGKYLMIECSIDGSERTNVVREQVGLKPIDPPWHNLFLKEQDVASWGTADLIFEKLVHLSSTYNFLSRIVYAKLADQKNEPLRYDSEINVLATRLPRDIGEFGPVKAWIWRKRGG
jgi:ubiquinone/menaquinone biosynthesis C-methylase UbiE